MAAAINAIVLLATGVGLAPMLSGFLAPTADSDQITSVRVILGMEKQRNEGGSLGGNVPGVALWDRLGRSIGTTFGTNDKIAQGSFRDIQVVANPGIGNVPAEYISITSGGDDAVCLSGFTVTFPGGGQSAWTGDVAAACQNTGAFVYLSGLNIASSDGLQSDQSTKHNPYCVWIDSNASGGIPHQGFGVHLPDFGNQVSELQAEAYSDNKDLMCQSGPRFRMYEKLRTENPILVFDPAIDYDENGKDIDTSKIINNPGKDGDQDKDALRAACVTNNKLKGCDKLATRTQPVIIPKRTDTPQAENHQHRAVHGRHFPKRLNSLQYADGTVTGTVTTASAPSISSVTDTTHSQQATSTRTRTSTSTSTAHPFRGHLVMSDKDYHSAKELCAHPNSYGPSFAALSEGIFCDMVEKKLYAICGNHQETMGTCCFDKETKDFQGCSNADKPLVARAASAPGPVFTNVQQW